MRVNVALYGYSQIDFDKAPVRRALRREGAAIRLAARRLISRRAVSDAGEYPGMDTGNTRRSVRVMAAKSGLAVVIAPRRTGNEKKGFFPAILVHGTDSIAPRADYIEAAFESRLAAATNAVREALQSALRPVNG